MTAGSLNARGGKGLVMEGLAEDLGQENWDCTLLCSAPYFRAAQHKIK